MSPFCIEESLFNYLESIKASLPTIYYQNSPNTGKAQPPTTEHIKVFLMPADTSAVGVATTDKTVGIFQLSVYVKDGTGTARAAEIATLLLAAFERGTQLINGVRIDKTGSVASGIPGGGWYHVPVSIPYRVFTR